MLCIWGPSNRSLFVHRPQNCCNTVVWGNSSRQGRMTAYPMLFPLVSRGAKQQFVTRFRFVVLTWAFVFQVECWTLYRVSEWTLNAAEALWSVHPSHEVARWTDQVVLCSHARHIKLSAQCMHFGGCLLERAACLCFLHCDE
ncbi:hypothetical protein TRVL_07903 [Trypanosoma vivax]|uniref:Uncharacterized protein n=1 Tax=Trypanosoma vivax (strain Y486) TaxID=1055687 RepID=G0U324_TRYVY|nr:hypothetical protein TRVL_07903 [Trypanosoma vivax]CCC50679.1 hypothetical protein TVY486_0905000 [Trypanosoma vivax Y486]